MGIAGRLGRSATRVLGVWIAVALLAGAVTAARSEPATEVATGGEDQPVSPALDVEPKLPRAVEAPPPSAPTTTVPPTTTSTLSAPSAPVAPPAPAVLRLEEPGMWVIRADGTAAVHLGDVGIGGRRGYGGLWSPDSDALLGLVSTDGIHYRLLRTGLDGSRRTYGLPKSPRIIEEPPAPRAMGAHLDVSGHLVAVDWYRDDGLSGSAAATLDLSKVVVEFEHCCGPVGTDDGQRFAFGGDDQVVVVDGRGDQIGEPFALGGRADGVAVINSWSSDGRHLLVEQDQRRLVLDTKTGAVQAVEFDNHPGVSWMGNGSDVLMEVHGLGATPTSLYVRTPGAAPRLVTADGSYAVSSPDGAHVVFGRSPYVNEAPGPASVHMIRSDGSGERLLAMTRNAIAFPMGWSPDGRWIAVHLGGPR